MCKALQMKHLNILHVTSQAWRMHPTYQASLWMFQHQTPTGSLDSPVHTNTQNKLGLSPESRWVKSSVGDPSVDWDSSSQADSFCVCLFHQSVCITTPNRIKQTDAALPIHGHLGSLPGRWNLKSGTALKQTQTVISVSAQSVYKACFRNTVTNRISNVNMYSGTRKSKNLGNTVSSSVVLCELCIRFCRCWNVCIFQNTLGSVVAWASNDTASWQVSP